MKTLRVELMVGWEDERTEDEAVVELFNALSRGDLMSHTYWQSHLTIWRGDKAIYKANP